ncbi:unnamed protein product [marine sediment metagenome]|uniref:Uncharacterized protein n=1 Tax=marine sediment metagenome TaxID=412755 RepID=X1KE17_9ZZZZ
MVVWQSQVEKPHDIDIFEVNRVVRAKGSGGFKFNKSEDVGLVALVRAKIRSLYERFFGPVSLVPGILSRGGIRARGGARAPGGVLLRPGILTAPVVSES